jgi:transposase-like protein
LLSDAEKATLAEIAHRLLAWYRKLIANKFDGSKFRKSRCRHRPVQCLNNILEQDHRAIKRWVQAKQGFREF